MDRVSGSARADRGKEWGPFSQVEDGGHVEGVEDDDDGRRTNASNGALRFAVLSSSIIDT